VTVSPHGTKILQLAELLSAAGSVGGLLLTHNGPEHGLAVNSGLEDPATGYSARLPLASPPDASAKISEYNFAQLGLMTGAADPMMNFPNGTVFTPYAVVRNVSGQPFAVTPTLWWMQGSVARSVPLPQLTVPPHATQNLNVPALLDLANLKNFNWSFNLVLDTTGKTGGLLISGGSVDQRNTYVCEVAPRGTLESISRSFAYWSTGNGDDTMVTFWNPADEPQDFFFTLFFAGGGHYRYAIHLEPRATRTLNISEVVNSQIPDADGNIIPAGAHGGSAQISGSQGENEHILVAVDAGVYNVLKATCGQVCVTCDGMTSTNIVVDPLGVAIGGSYQQKFVVQYDTGYQYDRTSGSSWSGSSNITVSSGLVTGTGAGPFNLTANDNQYEPVYTPNACADHPLPCPIATSQPSGSGSGTIQVPTSLEVLSDTTVISMSYAACSDNVYGAEIGVHYQVLDQFNTPLMWPNMEPQEKLTNLVVNGQSQPDPIPNWQDIGPSSYPGTSQYTDNNGQYWDAPVGYCFNVPITMSFTQPVSVLLFGTRYTLRTNSWSGQSSSQGHGSMGNGNDVSMSR